jgi:presenilin-like A22 family membrane protease
MKEDGSDESVKMKIFARQAWKLFVIESFLFSLTLSLGIATAIKINDILEVQKAEIPEFSIFQFIIYFFLTALSIFLFVRFFKFKKQKGAIFKFIYVSTVFWGGTLLLSAWVSDLSALFLMVALIIWRLKRPSILVQDACMVLAMAGAGSILGLTLTPDLVVILLVLFSIYDFIAVYKTKHMVEIAKGMIESRAILGLVIPPNLKGFKENLNQVEPGGRFMVLGGGDIVFPLLFCVSVIPYGISDSLIVALFSLIGLLAGFLFFINQKRRKAIPALPPIAFFSIIGYFITRFF